MAKKTTKKSTSKPKSSRRKTKSSGGASGWKSVFIILLLSVGFLFIGWYYGKDRVNTEQPGMHLSVDEEQEVPSVSPSEPEKVEIPDEEVSSESPLSNTDYVSYVNTIMEYRVDYPECFKKVLEAGDGKGATFQWENIVLNVYAEYNMLDWTLNDLLKYEEYQPTQKVVNDHHYVISGYAETGEMFYQKTVLYGDRSAYATVCFTFPAERETEVSSIIDSVFTYFPNRKDCPPYNAQRFITPREKTK